MRLDHPDYIKLAIAAYHEKLLNNELSPLLMHSTPANIRRECATVFQERYDKKDEPMLRAFFGPGEQGRKFLALIENFDVDKFRPLNSFLREEGKRNITDKNLDLLAWLIDFKYRPYNFGMEVFLTEKERQVLEVESPPSPIENGEDEIDIKQAPENVDEFAEKPEENIDEVKDITQQKDEQSPFGTIKETGETVVKDKNSSVKNTKWKNPVAVGLITAALSGTIYLSGIIRPDHTNDGCMYWAEDHYEPVSCTDNSKSLIVPLNPERMKKFMKITKADTISEKSIGVIHYLKTDGKIEYFTTGGNHPVYVTRPLKPLSSYMFGNYLQKKEIPDKNSLSEQYMKSLTNK